MKSEKYKALLAERENLPVFRKKTEILSVLRNNRVVVIEGQTGSGMHVNPKKVISFRKNYADSTFYLGR